MHTFFAILLFAHVLSASTSEQAAVGLDEVAPAAPVSLINLCKAHPVNYAAIRAEILSGHPSIKGVIQTASKSSANKTISRGSKPSTRILTAWIVTFTTA